MITAVSPWKYLIFKNCEAKYVYIVSLFPQHSPLTSVSSDEDIWSGPVNITDQTPGLDDIVRQEVEDGVQDRGQTPGYNDVSSWQLSSLSVQHGAA